MPSRELLLVAGEASGDLHGASLVRRLGSEASFFGLGGDQLRAAGMETVADFHEVSVVGLWEVLKVLPKAHKVFSLLLDEVDRRRPDAAILIDFPEFNLRLARQLKRRGVKVIYYVSPQVWAWRRGRLRMITRVVDKMLVFFGFELEFYTGMVDVTHVGHPLVDEVPELAGAWDEMASGVTPEVPAITLMPGSRSSEIKRVLPTLLSAARLLQQRQRCRLRLVRAPSVSREAIAASLAGCDLDVEIVSENRFRAIADSHLVLCASGTATLEVGLLRTPMIVIYKVGLGTSIMGRLLIRIPNISLVNLVLGSGRVAELLQRQATAERIAREAESLLSDRTRIDELRQHLGQLRGALGEGGASDRAAAAVSEFLARECPA